MSAWPLSPDGRPMWEPEPALLWHMVYTNAGGEQLACRRLHDLGYGPFYPHRHHLRPHRTRRGVMVAVPRPVLPRYLFLGRREEQGLMAANTCIGVSSVVQVGGVPQLVPRRFIVAWMWMVATGKVRSGGDVVRLGPVAVDEAGDACTMPGCFGTVGATEDGKREPCYVRGEMLTLAMAGGWHLVPVEVEVDNGVTVDVWLEFLGERRVVAADPQWLCRTECGAIQPSDGSLPTS